MYLVSFIKYFIDMYKKFNLLAIFKLILGISFITQKYQKYYIKYYQNMHHYHIQLFSLQF